MLLKCLVLAAVLACCMAQTASSTRGHQVTAGGSYDDIVVESSLNVRKKPTNVRQRRATETAVWLLRPKRQFNGGFGNPNFGSSSALANANAYNQQFGPNGFGASAANAGAQAFQTQGPLGGFGASASNAQSQGFQAGPNGLQGSLGASGGQTYNLPNGQTLSLTYANGVSFGPDGRPTVSKGNSIAFS